MFQDQNRETVNSTWKVAVSFNIIMTSVTRPCFTTQHPTCKTKTDFLVSDRSCPKTDGLGPHHWHCEPDSSDSDQFISSTPLWAEQTAPKISISSMYQMLYFHNILITRIRIVPEINRVLFWSARANRARCSKVHKRACTVNPTRPDRIARAFAVLSEVA